MSKEIFEVEFNATSFVSALDRAVEALNRFEGQSKESQQAVQTLGQGINGISFTAPINGLIRTSEAMKQVNFGVLALTDSQKKLAQSLSTNSNAWRIYGDATKRVSDETYLAQKQLALLGQIAENTTKKVKSLGEETKKTSGFLSSLKSGAVNILGALGVTAGIAGLVQFGKSVINVTAQFQDFRSILTNTLGSARLADNALLAIQDFALKTKFSVAEVTDVFIRLANTGFVPTTKELTKLADFAASRGKSINDVAEALIDAQVGQFRRLEEIGPKVQVLGDKVIFTFRGVQQIVDNNAESIKRYVLGVGEMEGVLGQNDATAKNLATSISNLGDRWDKFLLSLSKGKEGAFSATISFLDTILQSFTSLNNQLETYATRTGKTANIFTFLLPVVGPDQAKYGQFLIDLNGKVKGYTDSLIQSARTSQDFAKITRDLVANESLVLSKLEDRSKPSIKAVKSIYAEQLKAVQEAEIEYNDKLSKNTTKTDALADAKKQKLAEAKAKKERAERLRQNENYEKELIDYSDKIEKLRFENSRKTDALIINENARLLQVEKAEIDKKYRLLSVAQRDTLKKSAKEYYDLKAQYDVEAFKESQRKALLQIESQLKSDQESLALERINQIPNEYEKENLLIDSELTKQNQLIYDQLQDRQNQLEKQYQEGIIPTYSALMELLNQAEEVAREKNINAEKKAFNDRLKLAESYYTRLEKLAKDEAEKAQQTIEFKLANEVAIEAKRYENGEISLKRFGENKSVIENKYERLKIQNQIDTQIQELNALDTRYNSTLDAEKRLQLESQKRLLETSIRQGQSDLSLLDKRFEGFDSMLAKIFGIDKADEKGTNKLNAIKGAITSISQSAIDVLQSQNQAEQRAIDFAIRQQERRVSAALRIADAGNAEYLQIEQEKLDQLEIKREQAARRQLEINAALQASLILVAIAGAVSKLANPLTGVEESIASIGVIVASLGAGYALVSSLQSQNPSFYQGTDFVPLGNNPKGRDTVPANLHEGEAVIQADKNAKYAPTVKAIRRGLISPDVLNDFVLARVNGRSVEKTIENTDRMIDLSQMTERLKSLEAIMANTNDSVKRIGVNVNLDSDGFSASVENFLSRKDKIFKS